MLPAFPMPAPRRPAIPVVFLTVLITTIGWLWFRQTLDLPAVIGMSFIVVGVLIVNLFSKTLTH